MAKIEISACVVGLGYVGLQTASLPDKKGFDVYGVDNSEYVVDKINKGQIHIVEPDLDILVKSAVQSGTLCAGLEPKKRMYSPSLFRHHLKAITKLFLNLRVRLGQPMKCSLNSP